VVVRVAAREFVVAMVAPPLPHLLMRPACARFLPPRGITYPTKVG